MFSFLGQSAFWCSLLLFFRFPAWSKADGKGSIEFEHSIAFMISIFFISSSKFLAIVFPLSLKAWKRVGALRVDESKAISAKQVSERAMQVNEWVYRRMKGSSLAFYFYTLSGPKCSALDVAVISGWGIKYSTSIVCIYASTRNAEKAMRHNCVFLPISLW